MATSRHQFRLLQSLAVSILNEGSFNYLCNCCCIFEHIERKKIKCKHLITSYNILWWHRNIHTWAIFLNWLLIRPFRWQRINKLAEKPRPSLPQSRPAPSLHVLFNELAYLCWTLYLIWVIFVFVFLFVFGAGTPRVLLREEIHWKKRFLSGIARIT